MNSSEKGNYLLQKRLNYLNTLHEAAYKINYYSVMGQRRLYIGGIGLVAISITQFEFYGVLTGTLGISILLYAVYKYKKNHVNLPKIVKHIKAIEHLIFKKHKFVYCNCEKGVHFFSPEEKKIFNIKNNILFDEHHEFRKLRPLSLNIKAPNEKPQIALKNT